MSLNCGYQGSYSSNSRYYMSMESHGGMILTGGTEELAEKPVPGRPDDGSRTYL
jgi:hypothetical protein